MAANSLKATGPLQISWLRPRDDCTNLQCTMSTTLVITIHRFWLSVDWNTLQCTLSCMLWERGHQIKLHF